MREKYAHFCAVSEKNIFKGHTRCLVIEEAGVP